MFVRDAVDLDDKLIFFEVPPEGHPAQAWLHMHNWFGRIVLAGSLPILPLFLFNGLLAFLLLFFFLLLLFFFGPIFILLGLIVCDWDAIFVDPKAAVRAQSHHNVRVSVALGEADMNLTKWKTGAKN